MTIEIYSCSTIVLNLVLLRSTGTYSCIDTEYTAPPRVRKEQKLRQDARRERISDLLKKYGMVRQNEGWRDNPKWKTKSNRKRQR